MKCHLASLKRAAQLPIQKCRDCVFPPSFRFPESVCDLWTFPRWEGGFPSGPGLSGQKRKLCVILLRVWLLASCFHFSSLDIPNVTAVLVIFSIC